MPETSESTRTRDEAELAEPTEQAEPTDQAEPDGQPDGRPAWRRALAGAVAGARGRLGGLPRPVAAALVVLLLAGGAAGGWWWTHRGLPDGVAFAVGEQQVPVADLEQRMVTIQALYGVERPDGGEDLDAFWRDAAQSMAVGLVLDGLAADEGVVVSDQRVDQALAEYVTAFFGEGTAGQQAYALALSNSGASEQTVEDEVRRQLTVNDLFSVVTAEAQSVSDEDLAAAYADRTCELTVPEQRRLRNIVVADEAAAEAVLVQLQGGADVATVAASTSLDGASRAEGGEIGTLARADLEQAYGDAAFGAPAGGFFGPVRSQFGWNVGQVVEVVPPRLPELPEVADALRGTVFAERQAEVWRSWLGEELRAAEVEYADGYRPEDPFALPDSATPGASDDAAAGC